MAQPEGSEMKDELREEIVLALRQYRNDLSYPVASDSRDRRFAMIDKLIAKVSK